MKREYRCSKCGAPGTASCDCGAPYLPATELARRVLEQDPNKSNRMVAEEVGVSRQTVHLARKQLANGLPVTGKRKGRDGKTRRLPLSDKESARELKSSGVSAWIVPAKPLGKIPGDAKEKMQKYIDIIHKNYVLLWKLSLYAEQMSPELRHLMADNLRGLSKNLKDLSKAIGPKDWRKISRPYCDEEVPLRAEDTKWN